MIFDAARLPLPLRLKADLCIVGSGAGGAAAAMIAAEAGLRVVVLEAGAYLTPADMVQREEEMLPLLYWDSGGRTTKDRAVKIHQGRGVGGSSLHNLNLC
jgi:choline dehydrogenase-like flavoprotein